MLVDLEVFYLGHRKNFYTIQYIAFPDSADVSLQLDSPMFWALGSLTPKNLHLIEAVFFQLHMEETTMVRMDVH